MKYQLGQVLLVIFILMLLKGCHGRWLLFSSRQDVVGESQTQPSTDAIVVTTPASVVVSTEPPNSETTQSSNAAQETGQPSAFSSYFMGPLRDVFKSALHKAGNYLPIRGVASVAADLGIPGGEFVIGAMTSHETPTTYQADTYTPKLFAPVSSSEPREGLSANVNPRFASWARADVIEPPPVTAGPLPSYREEMSSFVGAMYGEKECMLKLACLSGKRLSAVRGASAVTMMLSTAAGVLPESVQGPYAALRNSMMYTDDCKQYQCSENKSPKEL